MKLKLKISIICIVLIIVPVGFLYFIALNGYSPYHAGLGMNLLSEQDIENRYSDREFITVTQENLEQYPKIMTMINLLLEENENLQGTRSLIVDFDTYRIYTNNGETSIQNYMSDDGASDLYRDFGDRYDTLIKYEGYYFTIGNWIA